MFASHWLALMTWQSCSVLLPSALRNSTGQYILNGNFVVTAFHKIIRLRDSLLEYSGANHKVERINATRMIHEDIEVQVGSNTTSHGFLTYSLWDWREKERDTGWERMDWDGVGSKDGRKKARRAAERKKERKKERERDILVFCGIILFWCFFMCFRCCLLGVSSPLTSGTPTRSPWPGPSW